MFQVFEVVLGQLDEQEEVVSKIAKAINPLIDDEDQVQTFLDCYIKCHL